MVVQTRNKAIVEDATRQITPTFKKPLIVPSPLGGESSSTSHNKGKQFITSNEQKVTFAVKVIASSKPTATTNEKSKKKRVIRDSYLTNKDGSNGIVKKSGKFATPIKSESKKTISLTSLC